MVVLGFCKGGLEFLPFSGVGVGLFFFFFFGFFFFVACGWG